jgi:hypothetical protein
MMRLLSVVGVSDEEDILQALSCSALLKDRADFSVVSPSKF